MPVCTLPQYAAPFVAGASKWQQVPCSFHSTLVYKIEHSITLTSHVADKGSNHALKAGREPRDLGSYTPDHGCTFVVQVHQDGAKRVMFVKGAPDRLLHLCSTQVVDNDLSKTAPIQREFWQAEQAALSNKGLRVLALCRLVGVMTYLRGHVWVSHVT